jgi:hypothetical protein
MFFPGTASPIGAFAPAGPAIQQVSGLSLSDCDSCESGCCDAPAVGCESKGCSDCCCCTGWCYHIAVFGEFLYLRPRDAEVAYSVEVNNAVSPPAVPLQVGPLGIVDPDYTPSWRGGLTWAMTNCTSITAQYMQLNTSTYARNDLDATGNQILSLLTHPSASTVGQGGVFSDARYDVDVRAFDIDYRQLLFYDCGQLNNFLVGVRYAHLNQELYSNLPINGNETVDTDIDFEGIGLRAGYEMERVTCHGLLGYAKLHGSLLAGDWKADYDQGSNFDASEVDTFWRGGRLVPVVDLEVGVGWTSKRGFWRAQMGYVYSAWFNAVKTDEWIKAVQSNNFVDMSDQITFDGLVCRIETRF